MTLTELLKICGEKGFFPRVRIKNRLKNATSNEGVVTVLKPDGCAVRFDGMSWDTWLWADTQKDSRKKYMADLDIVE